ncbi:hypothetical protein BLOT_013377 [Blomia tropicalis]|nr:hypothetical protein BLOT_013377 [Blomia tropicalis]
MNWRVCSSHSVKDKSDEPVTTLINHTECNQCMDGTHQFFLCISRSYHHVYYCQSLVSQEVEGVETLLNLDSSLLLYNTEPI